MTFQQALRGVSSIMLDTAPMIYHLEGNPRYAPLMREFFRVRAEQGILLVTSPVTLAECLVHPIERQLDALVRGYEQLITKGERTTFWPITEREAKEAARLRAEHGLRLLDAFQAAVAIVSGCQAILTNDGAFARLSAPSVVILDEIELV